MSVLRHVFSAPSLDVLSIVSEFALNIRWPKLFPLLHRHPQNQGCGLTTAIEHNTERYRSRRYGHIM